MRSIETHIEQLLQAHLQPAHLQIVNESNMHGSGSDASHIAVYVVADRFEGLPLLQQQRLVYAALQPLLAQGLHALRIKTMPTTSWQQAGGPTTLDAAPACRGGTRIP